MNSWTRISKSGLRSLLTLSVSIELLLAPSLPAQNLDLQSATATGKSAAAGCSSLIANPSGGLPNDSNTSDSHGLNLSNLDRAISPCDNFFQFAAGGWIKSNPIPPDRSRWSTFDQLQDRNEDALHKILDDAAQAKDAPAGSNVQKIGDFYAACMDESSLNSAGLKTLDADLKTIAAIHDQASLQQEIAHLQREGVNAVFSFGSEQDLKNSNEMIAAADQGGLGLPDKDYYVNTTERMQKIREGYVLHLTNMFKLMGDDAATASVNAAIVLSIETQLAKSSMDRALRRDPDNIYHRMAIAQVSDLTPEFSWPAYFKEIGGASYASVDVNVPDFFKTVNSTLQSVPLANWQVYLRWQLVHSVARTLSQPFVEENFNFYGRTLQGTKEMLPRWRRCVQATDRQLGEALGQAYVKDNFPPEAKAQAVALVRSIMGALHQDLSTLDWMSPATRQQAIKKLDAMTLKIGYPDKWRDYSNFHVTRASYTENYLHGQQFEFARDLAKIGKPPDRKEWRMTPPTVNAYYNPLQNEMVFPAGILQPPFFDAKGDPAINYGGIGAVMGHEMTHGFDDEGAKFDPEGNLKNWWTPEDLKNFEARGECIAKQFGGYEAEPGVAENGKLVEGESIADLGGLTLAHIAFENTLKGKPAPPKLDGFTEEQRFFLGFGQIWAGASTQEFARLMVSTDPHPLEKFRTNGTLSNMPSFAKAFDCQAGSAMVRPEGMRCRIW
jgi:putative endopeptidase